MTAKDLDAWMSSRSPDEGAEAQAISAFLTVLKHKAIIEGKDLDRLAYIAEHGKSERHRLRASQLLNGARQRAADALAGALAVKEQVMDAKGLSKAGTQITFDLSGLSMEKLQQMARGDFKALGAGDG